MKGGSRASASTVTCWRAARSTAKSSSRSWRWRKLHERRAHSLATTTATTPWADGRRWPDGHEPGHAGAEGQDFKGTLFRLLRYFAPMKVRLGVILAAAIISTIFTIVGPKIMGLVTTKLFEDLLMMFHHVPGAKVDFNYIGHVLLILLGLYVLSSIFMYVQQYILAGVAQTTVYTMRKQIEDKLTRLPLRYFDERTHGEILSRAVNDMDNISTTLQQSLTQLITSAVTLIGVVVMMLTISPLLSLVVLITFPLSLVVTMGVAKRS